MIDLQKTIKALEEFNGEHEAIEETKNFQPDLIGMNAERLEEEGLRADGTDILDLRTGRGYTPFTVQIKQAKGQRTDHVTLKDTGDFHKSIKMEYSGDEFKAVANDPKTKKIVTKYGSKILGFTEENIEEIRKLIYPGMLERFKTAANAHQ